MRENKQLEFKENISTNTYLKTISAFANYDGGKIIFGISDNGVIRGIDNPIQACLDIENKINDNIKPMPRYTLDIQDNSTIFLEVYRGQFKPYLYKGKAYKRNDSSTVEVDRLELNRLILEGNNLSYEEIASSFQDLTFIELENELKKVLGISFLTEDILRTLDLFTSDMKYNNVAALLSDNNQFIGVDIIRFGDTIDEIMDRETYDNISILSMLKNSVNMYKKYYQYEKIEETSRTIIDKIPEKAFRETIANALVHRLWDVQASIKISMFNDKIEITSPGGLPSGLSKDEYLNGQISLLRNPILGNLFYRLRYIEKFGTGVLRINNAYDNSILKPEFKVFDNSISIVLPLTISKELLSTEELSILNILKNNIKLSRAQISKTIGLSKDKTIRILNSLIEKKMIQKSGVGRNTKYYIL
ncbi:MAG: ATP-binding protein [Bacilli bacterium]|nr:ATP-binding protein [Bacilli bacterium]